MISGDVDDSARRLYTWVCPICGASQTGLAGDADPAERARNSLLAHIRSTDGDGHGPRYELPETVDTGGIDGHVEVTGR